MSGPTAFLSYTRKDDEFFGGYVTAFRRALEAGVHVATGQEQFRLFQDIDGIVIGEPWQKKIADVIDGSSFLIPMLSPLFFNSQACRDEVTLFLQHEKRVVRDDLILPVYFIESPRLRKPEETAKDPVAREIAKRQMFDWREKAKLPLVEPAARYAIFDLAAAIAAALDRLPAGSTKPSPAAGGDAITRVHRENFEAASHISVTVSNEGRKELSERAVLWVDDHPSNNLWERRALESYGMRFTLAATTEEAEQLLKAKSFHAIISDLGRSGDSRAGFTLLAIVRATHQYLPYFIYCGGQAPKLVQEARRRGAQGLTNNPNELVAWVVNALR